MSKEPCPVCGEDMIDVWDRGDVWDEDTTVWEWTTCSMDCYRVYMKKKKGDPIFRVVGVILE